MPRSDTLNRDDVARRRPRRIAASVHGTSITLAARTRPRWRSPMLTTGRRKEGASVKPLEEFPIITEKCARQLRYRRWPKWATHLNLSEFLEQIDCNRALMRVPCASAFAAVKTAA